MSTIDTPPVAPNDTNDIRRTKDNNDNVVSVQPRDNRLLQDEKNMRQMNYDLLAQDLAQELGDQSHLNLYRLYAKRYSESFLRRIVAEVKQTPLHKIKKSRGALFTYLIKRYGNEDAENSLDQSWQ